MDRRLSVIIPVWNEKATIAAVIRECFKLDPASEVIVVANGTKDGSREIAQREGAVVITIPHPLGHDVGRSVRARRAAGDLLLFLDGDMVIPAAQLAPFIAGLHRVADIVLNAYNGPVGVKHAHDVVVAKHVLNAALNRPDLEGWSLCTRAACNDPGSGAADRHRTSGGAAPGPCDGCPYGAEDRCGRPGFL